MPDISIQFYATPADLLSFVKEVMRGYALHAVVMRFRPFEAIHVGSSNLDVRLTPLSDFRRWAFTVGIPRLPVENELDHADKNPDHLRLEVGRYDGNSLEESWPSCRTENKSAFTIWSKIASRLKEKTMGGITAINRRNGLPAEYKNQRYTAGAKSFEDGGVAMLSAVGSKGPIIRLGLLVSQAIK
jgi:hypothetical protein